MKWDKARSEFVISFWIEDYDDKDNDGVKGLETNCSQHTNSMKSYSECFYCIFNKISNIAEPASS
jgi:hypothetical protein